MLHNDNYYLRDITKKVGGKVGLRDNNNMLLKKIAEKIGQGGGGTVIVDDELDNTSPNPVENRVITGALNGKASIDDVPTKTSDLTNDSGFLTQHQDISGKVDTSDLGTLNITITYIDSTTETIDLTKWSE